MIRSLAKFPYPFLLRFRPSTSDRGVKKCYCSPTAQNYNLGRVSDGSCRIVQESQSILQSETGRLHLFSCHSKMLIHTTTLHFEQQQKSSQSVSTRTEKKLSNRKIYKAIKKYKELAETYGRPKEPVPLFNQYLRDFAKIVGRNQPDFTVQAHTAWKELDPVKKEELIKKYMAAYEAENLILKQALPEWEKKMNAEGHGEVLQELSELRSLFDPQYCKTK